MKTLEESMKLNNTEEQTYSDINIGSDKKIVAFLGASKSGTSCILNNLAQLISRGTDVAILDTTQNKNTYYIYTKNSEELRKTALTSIEDLKRGKTNGIKANHNLTVYTSLPGTNDHMEAVESILETLLKKHSVILLDCDFKTPINYFKYATELFLVQSMDVLTIQPFTEFLSKLKKQGVLQQSKLRIIINKFVDMKGVTEKEIIGGMAFYNHPTMSYMNELFDRNQMKYITIPFDKDIYEKYLEAVTNCDMNLNGYPYNFIQILNELNNEILPITK